MAMLAEPRRKQKVINLRAKYNAWSNDSNKFGQRMLEKMGWSTGKGLGANETGIVEHVVARYKNDDKGLGFEDKNDQWTKHEDDFNSLLANLSNGNKDDEKLHSGVSLEVKSKKSKARVHYHKFTRGKDLTRYSEKDLANIFGKRTLKPEEKPEKPLVVDVKTTEQKFTEKGSMVDYFKSKLAAFKSNNSSASDSHLNKNEPDCGFKGFSGTGCEDEELVNQQGFGFQGFSNSENDETKVTENAIAECIPHSKKKKNKKHKDQDKSSHNGIKESEENSFQHFSGYENDEIKVTENSIEECVTHSKKNKKKMKKYRDQDESSHNEIKAEKKLDTEDNTNYLVENIIKTKKSKKKKRDWEVEEVKQEIEIIEDHNTDEYVPKKKKKRKNKVCE